MSNPKLYVSRAETLAYSEVQRIFQGSGPGLAVCFVLFCITTILRSKYRDQSSILKATPGAELQDPITNLHMSHFNTPSILQDPMVNSREESHAKILWDTH